MVIRSSDVSTPDRVIVRALGIGASGGAAGAGLTGLVLTGPLGLLIGAGLGVVVGLLVGVVNGLILLAVVSVTSSRPAAALACAITSALCLVALMTLVDLLHTFLGLGIVVVFTGFALGIGPYAAHGARPGVRYAAMGRSVRFAPYLSAGAIAGAAIAAVVGLVIGLIGYPATAAFAAFEGAVFGVAPGTLIAFVLRLAVLAVGAWTARR